MIDVFVSRPTWIPGEFEAGLDRFVAFLDSHDLRPRTIGITDYPAASPLDEVISLMRRCRGAIILGYPQLELLTGRIKGVELESPLDLPTEWNHIEAGLAYASGLPLLLIHHPGISRGVFDRGAVNRFIHEVDLAPHDWVLSSNIAGALKTWKSEVIEADEPQPTRPTQTASNKVDELTPDAQLRTFEIEAELDTAVRLLEPSYRIPCADDLGGEWRKFYDESSGFPVMCSGSFTGRTTGECAVFLLGRDDSRYKVVVFSEDASGSPVFHELESGAGNVRNRYLRTLEPGSHRVSRIVWKHGGPRTLHLRRVGVELGTFESASCAYYWDDQAEEFAEQWLSD